MKTVNDSNPINGADTAINRVLEAEQAAKQEIIGCRRKALAILREARARSRVLADRTDRRINRVHTLADTAIDRTLADIASEARALSDNPEMTPELSARLDVAIDRLIEEALE